jgi:hypothetical protein
VLEAALQLLEDPSLTAGPVLRDYRPPKR